jgi:4-aminobutyrate aminotransferase-like enzyme
MLPELITRVPGPRSCEVLDRLARCESRNVTYRSPSFPVVWERAEGVNVWDADGNRFLDLTSAFGVAGLGFGAEPVHAALTAQASRLWHGMGDVHPSEAKVKLCEELVALTFGRWGGEGRVLLGNSGFEAVEAALKTALLATGRRGVLAFEGSYHGLGYGALDVTHRAEFREPFLRQLPGFARFAPYPDCDRCGGSVCSCPTRCLPRWRKLLEAELSGGDIGAIIVEPVQGRGGDRFPPPWFLPLLRELADAHGALLIVDEIYTGLYRTGAVLGCDVTKVVPDLVCLGKAMSSGFPISACVGKRAVMDAWPESRGEAWHTSTHLGNPLGCAMAVAALGMWRSSEWPEHACRLHGSLGGALHGFLGGMSGVRVVRGQGALWGVEFETPDGYPDGARVGRLIEAALSRGILVLGSGAHGEVLSFCPPLTLTDEEARWSVEVLAGLADS